MLEILFWELGYLGFNVERVDYNLKNKKREYYFKLDNTFVKGAVLSHNNKVCLDRVDTFNKFSDCPIQLPIPQTVDQVQFIISKLKLLSTDEWYDISNELSSESWITSYPEVIENVQATRISSKTSTSRVRKNAVYV